VKNGKVKQSGNYAEFIRGGESAAAYKNLFAVDSNGKKVSGEIKVTDDSIQLLIDDSELVYPIVVDPIVVSLVKKLTVDEDSPADTVVGTIHDDILSDSANNTGCGCSAIY